MELYEANRILRTVKTAVVADGVKLPSAVETDALMMLLGKTDPEKYLAPKIKHARTLNRETAAFKRLMSQICFIRALCAVGEGALPDPVSAISLTMLHKTLLGDVDEDAGKLRTVNASTDGSAHTDPKYLPGSVRAVVTKMNEPKSAPEASKDDFAGYLSHYMRELVILHPFARYSDFTVRVFLVMFCKVKGFSLCYQRVTPAALRAAEQAAFSSDDVAPLFKLFSECLSYDHKTETRAAPRTRREVAKDVSRTFPQKPQRDAAAKQTKPDLSEDEVLKRAVRLQQKISRLNEQLAELIRPLGNKSDGNKD